MSLDLINSVIIEKEDPMVFRGEGCLSFPNIYKDTRRFNQITIENYNLLGYKETLVFEGFEAVAIQHEIDHMDGIVFLDRLQQPLVAGNKVGRNDLCPCGSGKKFKKCCSV
jgi:peptide deformylase